MAKKPDANAVNSDGSAVELLAANATPTPEKEKDRNKISAKLAETDRVVTVEFKTGDSLAEMVQKFGEEVVFSRAQSALVIDIQALVRRLIKAGKTDSDIQGEVTKWIPGVKTVLRMSASERAVSALNKLTPEERRALLEKFST